MKTIALGCVLTFMMCGDDDVPTDAGIDAPDRDSEVRDTGADTAQDASSDPERCVELRPGDEQVVRVDFTARIATADIVFLIDSSASMGEEIEEIAATLQEEIAPELAASIDDVQFAVAEFSDFPQSPYGESIDTPFRLAQRSTSDVSAVQAAVEALTLRSGGDVPESQVVALHQLATGEGLGEFIPPAECPEKTFGYPCFRANGARIVLLFTDAQMHMGPTELAPYASLTPEPVSYEETIRALNDSGIRVLGIHSGAFDMTGRTDLVRVAEDTRAVTDTGDAIVVDIGSRGEELDTGVVGVVRALVDDVSFDIELLLEDGEGELDALNLVDAIRTAGALGATDLGDRYADVRPDTEVAFELVMNNRDVSEGAEPQETILNVVFRDRATRLFETSIRLVVPSATEGCPR